MARGYKDFLAGSPADGSLRVKMSKMIKTHTGNLTDLLSHGQFTAEKDAEVTHNIRGRDRIVPTCRLRFVFSRRLSLDRVPNQIMSDFDGFSWRSFAEHQA